MRKFTVIGFYPDEYQTWMDYFEADTAVEAAQMAANEADYDMVIIAVLAIEVPEDAFVLDANDCTYLKQEEVELPSDFRLVIP